MYHTFSDFLRVEVLKFLLNFAPNGLILTWKFLLATKYRILWITRMAFRCDSVNLCEIVYLLYLILLKNSDRSFHWKKKQRSVKPQHPGSFKKKKIDLLYSSLMELAPLHQTMKKMVFCGPHIQAPKYSVHGFMIAASIKSLSPTLWSRWATVRTKDGWFFGRYAFL